MILHSQNKIAKLLIICFFFLPIISKSQIIYSETSNSPQTLRFDNYNFMEKTYNPKIIGSAFIYEDWQIADIKMTTDSNVYQNIQVKIDVLNNVVEIKAETEIKILPANLTSFLRLTEKNELFITRNVLGNYILNGFSKVLYNGKTSLLCNYSARVKEAKYNVALDVGNKDDELIIEKNLYLLINKELKLVDKNKKHFIQSFFYNPKIQEFIKEKNISPKNENDLILLLIFIDKIV